MAVAFHVLDECDISLQPAENGLFNKHDINEITRKKYYELVNEHNSKNTEANMQPTDALFEYMKPQLCFGNLKELQDKVLATRKMITPAREYCGRNIIVHGNQYHESDVEYLAFKELLLEINSQLENSNQQDSKWIPFYDNLLATTEDYLKQIKSQQIAVMPAHIGFIFDWDLVGLDLSSKQKHIELLEFLNKCYKNMNVNSNITQYKFFLNKNTHKIFYYNAINNDRIKILTPLEIDLMYNDMYLLNHENDNNVSELRYYLKESIKSLNNDFLLVLYKEVYEQNRSLVYVSQKYNRNYQELIGLKKLILSQLDNYKPNSTLIKPRTKMLVLPEDYK